MEMIQKAPELTAVVRPPTAPCLPQLQKKVLILKDKAEP